MVTRSVVHVLVGLVGSEASVNVVVSAVHSKLVTKAAGIH